MKVISILKKYKWVVIISIILVVIIISFVIYYRNFRNRLNDLDSKVQSSITEDKTVNDLAFTNISCDYDEKVSTLKYIISNISQTEDIVIGKYQIVIYDSKDNLIATIEPNINQKLISGEYYETSSSINLDICNASYMEINKVE
ncbi:MAG: hypothetical protein IJ509_00155 [Bacilli bacterium]|nr:hypothetical protein [Bacilli bacterium]